MAMMHTPTPQRWRSYRSVGCLTPTQKPNNDKILVSAARSRSPTRRPLTVGGLQTYEPTAHFGFLPDNYRWNITRDFERDVARFEFQGRLPVGGADVQLDWRWFRQYGDFASVWEDGVEGMLSYLTNRVHRRVFFIASQAPHEMPTMYNDVSHQVVLPLAVGDHDAMMTLAKEFAYRANRDLPRNYKCRFGDHCPWSKDHNVTHVLALVASKEESFNEEFDPTRIE